jgi:hypothetical protein
MAEPIKLQPDELTTVQSIQSRKEEKVFQFGKLYLDRLQLDENVKQLVSIEEKTKADFLALIKEEQDWISSIAAKYGDGNLSIKDGTFIPV